MSTSRYSLNSFGESSSASMISLSSEDCGDRNIFSPGPSSPTYKLEAYDREQHTPDSLFPPLSPLPPRHNYALANHITMEENLANGKKSNRDRSGSRFRTMSETNYHQNRNKQRESISSIASSTGSAKAYGRKARNLRRAESCKNNSRDDSSLGRQSGSTTSLNKKPLTDSKKVAYNRNEITFNVRKAMYGRRGWMVMPTEETVDLKQFKPEVLESVTNKIRTMELSGVTVPDQIKVRLNEC